MEMWSGTSMLRQKADARATASAMLRDQTEWPSLDAQRAIHLLLSHAATQLGAPYAAHVLKHILRNLGASAELHTPLLELHLELKQNVERAAHNQLAPDSSWSTLAFDVAQRGPPLRVRVGSHIGGGAETGCVLWPAALALAALVRSAPQLVAHSRVIELGAGVGLPGLLCASHASLVVLTDIVAETLANLRYNASLLAPEAARRVRVDSLDWRDCAAGVCSLPRCDLVLASDVVYEPTLLAALAGTLETLLVRDCARALVTAEQRTAGPGEAFEHGLEAHGLAWDCRSAEAVEALRAEACPFFVDEGELGRLRVLEVFRRAGG